MTIESLDISHRLDAGTVAIFRDVAVVAASLSIDYLVIGASGRDLILSRVYGLPIQRATNDYDFAFQLGHLAEYEELKNALLKRGFTKEKQPQRLTSPQGLHVDLVPFGSIAHQRGTIRFPPGDDREMSVLGFTEALAHAQWLRLSHEPLLDVPVVSLQGLTLLKLIAWSDRPKDHRAKDAQDVRHIIESYSKVPPSVSGIWDKVNYLERFGGDIDLVAAATLGRQTRSITGDASIAVITELLIGPHLEAFVVDMGARHGQDFARNFSLMEAFREGFVPPG